MTSDEKKYANTLTVRGEVTENEADVIVTWCSGVQKQGKITVHLPPDCADKLVTAELSVMQYIIDELSVLGNEPALKGIQLIFSAPDVKKIHSNTSKKYHLYPYAYFLTTRFAACDVKISADTSWILSRAENNVHTIELNGPFGQMIFVPKYGKVAITKHIIDQYAKRMNNISPDIAWKTLVKTLSHGNLKLLSTTEQRKSFDMAQHKQEAIRLYDTITRWCFVIAPNDYGQTAIVTAYIR